MSSSVCGRKARCAARKRTASVPTTLPTDLV
jgi:hypothetical protein